MAVGVAVGVGVAVALAVALALAAVAVAVATVAVATVALAVAVVSVAMALQCVAIVRAAQQAELEERGPQRGRVTGLPMVELSSFLPEARLFCREKAEQFNKNVVPEAVQLMYLACNCLRMGISKIIQAFHW
jgi:hypothetical protein